MRNTSGACLVLLLVFLMLHAPPLKAQTESPAPQPGGKVAVQGDPFADTPVKDPFADLSVFEEKTDAARSGAGRERTVADQSAGLELHGYLESRNRIRTSDAEALSLRQRLWLESELDLLTLDEPRSDSPARLFASAALDFDPAASDLSDDVPLFHPCLKEMFFTWETESAALMVGRKLERIGTGDGVNPMDLINPLDHRDPLATGRADSRLPVLLVKGLAQLPTFDLLQEASLELFLIPFPQVNQLNSPGSPWESPGLASLRRAGARGKLILRDQVKPSQSLANAECGARLAATFSGWDLALIGFYGFTNAPVLARNMVTNQAGHEELEITPIHPSFAALGFTFAKGLEHSTIRGEISLKPNLPVMISDYASLPGYERHRVVEGVLGWDRTFGTNFYVNFQLFCTAIGGASDLEELVSDEYEYGITYDVHDLFWDDALTAGARGIASFSGEGCTFECFADYELTDDLLLSASLFLFEGPESGQYGQYDYNDFFSLRLRYSF